MIKATLTTTQPHQIFPYYVSGKTFSISGRQFIITKIMNDEIWLIDERFKSEATETPAISFTFLNCLKQYNSIKFQNAYNLHYVKLDVLW